MKIISKEKSNLIDRTELIAVFPHIGKPTPKTGEIKKAAATELKADENLVVIKEIYTQYGEVKRSVLLRFLGYILVSSIIVQDFT